MNKWIIVIVAAAVSPAFADPPAMQSPVSPWGSSPYVVAYNPPPEPPPNHGHHGVTLELATGFGSTSIEQSAGVVSFAIGGWLAHDFALAFRVTSVGSFGFVGGSAQYSVTTSFWAGLGLGSLSERGMDQFGGTTRTDGTGGFARVGYQLGQSGPHALYLSAEVQAGSIEQTSRAVALLAIGYQLL